MVAAFHLDIDGLADRFDDMTPLMERIGAYGEESTVYRFETGVGPDGEAWTPSYRARTQGGKTLDDTSRLKGSMTHYASAHAAEWGTNVIYAGVHQGGLTIRPKSADRLTFQIPGLGWRSAEEIVMPKREFLGLDSDDRDEIEAIGGDYIAEPLS